MSVEEWPIKFTFRTDKLEGELVPKGVQVVMLAVEEACDLPNLLEKHNSVDKLHSIVAYILRWSSPTVLKAAKPWHHSAAELKEAKMVWIKFVQTPMEEDLHNSVSEGGVRKKVHGPYKRMSPYRDEDGVWRIGSRMRDFTPFTEDHKPAILLPRDSRYTELLMIKAHRRGHVGVNATVAKFRMAGYWTTQAGKLAKKVKNSCTFCRYLDHHPIHQQMGTFAKDRLINPVAWGHVELDLMGPYLCRSDVNKRCTIKVAEQFIVTFSWITARWPS